MQNNKIVIYYCPVQPELFPLWEYYQVDLKMLKATFETVIVCHSHTSVIKNILKADVIYAWWWHSSCLVILLAKLLGRKVISTGAIHMFDYSQQPDFYSNNFFYRLACKLGLRFSDLNLFISQDQMLSICSHLKVKNPQLLYSSLYETHIPKAKLTVTSTSQKVMLCYHSHLTKAQIERKGLIALLPAFSNLVAKGLDVGLIIFGKTGDGVKSINQFCINNNLVDHVTIVLDPPKITKMEIFQKSDLLVNVSFMEGFGNACLEAMSVGLPVAVSRFGASPELVPDKNLISMAVNSQCIQEVLDWYIELSMTEKVELREKAFKRANENFGFMGRVEGFKALLNDIS